VRDDGARPRVAVYTFSQTGQLNEVLTALLTPAAKAGAEITTITVRPDVGYPFPWPIRRFFGIFPEAADPETTVGFTLDPAVEPAADLVVLGFQVWYLAPSMPIRSLLAGRRFAGADVLGVVACRNMWYSAALDVQRRVADGGARYLGTIAAIDDAPALVTFVTTLRWLLAGRRAPFWRFPAAGVSAAEIDRMRQLGDVIAEALTGPDRTGEAAVDRVRSALRVADPAPVDVPIAAGDLIAGRAFGVWGRLVRGRRSRLGRAAVLSGFVGVLCSSILVGLPILAAAAMVGRSQLDAAVRRRLAPALVGDGSQLPVKGAR
jgi:hypothetical protein